MHLWRKKHLFDFTDYSYSERMLMCARMRTRTQTLVHIKQKNIITVRLV